MTDRSEQIMAISLGVMALVVLLRMEWRDWQDRRRPRNDDRGPNDDHGPGDEWKPKNYKPPYWMGSDTKKDQ